MHVRYIGHSEYKIFLASRLTNKLKFCWHFLGDGDVSFGVVDDDAFVFEDDFFAVDIALFHHFYCAYLDTQNCEQAFWFSLRLSVDGDSGHRWAYASNCDGGCEIDDWISSADSNHVSDLFPDHYDLFILA